MYFSANEGKIASAKHWRSLAADCWSDAGIMLRSHGVTRRRIVDTLHGSIERDLLGLLAEQGKLTEADRGHNIASLAKKAGLIDRLDPQLKNFVYEYANAHIRATYPGEGEIEPWEDDAVYNQILINMIKLHNILGQRPSNQNERETSSHDE